MFISQVSFEASKENEEKLHQIMKQKYESALDAEGCVGSECWKNETEETVAYTLITRWSERSCFQAWMKASHQNQGEGAPRERLELKKNGTQYEVIDL